MKEGAEKEERKKIKNCKRIEKHGTITESGGGRKKRETCKDWKKLETTTTKHKETKRRSGRQRSS